jgi:hypothetical protein
VDKNATWKNDELFATRVDIAKLPVNEPGCGWAKLFIKSLPSLDQLFKGNQLTTWLIMQQKLIL